MFTRSKGVYVIASIALWSACIRGADISWQGDYALRGLSEVRLVVVASGVKTSTVRPLAPLVQAAVQDALKKMRVDVVPYAGHPLTDRTPVFDIEISEIDESLAKPLVYCFRGGVTERFRLMRDSNVVGSVITWYDVDTRVLSGDPESTILRGIDALMAKFAAKLNYANSERHDEHDEATPRPSGQGDR